MERISVNRFSFRRKGSWRNKDKNKEEAKEEFDMTALSYISQDEARNIEEELCTKFGFSMDQLLELSGYCCAVAIARYYPPETLPKDHAAVLVCCGPGNNGGDGLVCARHLKLFGYKPSVFYPKINNRPLFQNLRLQCEQMDMPFLSFFPSEAHLIADSYNVVVDAIFGHNYVGPATSEFSIIIDKLKQIHTDVPICSIDIPSGWDVDEGPREELGLQPDMLISLTAPKRCASTFRGKHHVLGGRFVLEEKFHLNLPPYPHTDPIVELKTQTLHAQHSPLPPSSSSSSTAAE